MNSDVDDVKSRLNVIDVLGEYIRLDKAGSNYRSLCPFHNEKSPSFMISEEKQMWHCFGCGKGGDIFAFVMEMEGVDFREALKLLAEKAGVQLKTFDPKKVEQKNRTLEILELATKWYEYQLWNGPGKNKIVSYLRERGLTDDTIKTFRIGYAPNGWRNIIQFLTKRGYQLEEIKKTGLVVDKATNIDSCYDRFRGRVMFPIADYSGKVLGYSARVAPGGDETQAKYINTPETEVYHKSKILYGIDKAKSEMKQHDFVLLVEGNMDVIASWQAGIKNTVAVSGTALTIEQVGIIKRYTRNIKMFFDMDEAGQNATKKSMKLCFGQDVNVLIVELPFGKDAAELAKEDPTRLVSAVEQASDGMEYVLKNALTKYDAKKAEDKKIIAEIMFDMIATLDSSIAKSHWIKVLADEIDTPEIALTDMFKKVNLRSRMSEVRSHKESDTFLVTDKLQGLIDELIRLLLGSAEAWKEGQKDNDFLISLKDRLLNSIMERGTECDFQYDLFIESLAPAEKARAEKLYFEKKFRLNLNNELEEIIISDPCVETQKCIREIRREIKRRELEKITSDLKFAEGRQDKKAIELLREEYTRIAEELNNVSQ